jgi:hypothetical protein
MCAWVGNQWSHGVVIARVRTDIVQSLRHQHRDLHQLTYRTSRKIGTHPTIRGESRCVGRPVQEKESGPEKELGPAQEGISNFEFPPKLHRI